MLHRPTYRCQISYLRCLSLLLTPRFWLLLARHPGDPLKMPLSGADRACAALTASPPRRLTAMGRLHIRPCTCRGKRSCLPPFRAHVPKPEI